MVVDERFARVTTRHPHDRRKPDGERELGADLVSPDPEEVASLADDGLEAIEIYVARGHDRLGREMISQSHLVITPVRSGEPGRGLPVCHVRRDRSETEYQTYL
jgi:hypothetical protein